MSQDVEKHERQRRADRLVQARKAAGFKGPKSVCDQFGWNVNNYKAHEQGLNGFGQAAAKKYARAFKVSLNWLYFGNGTPDDVDVESSRSITDVPFISWVSAGQLREQDAIMSYDDFPTYSVLDLPDGDWIALRVDGNSMNKISPPESVIIVNRRDKRLVANACYLVADETGSATYKRYRPGENPSFQPASYEDVPPPVFQGSVTVIGRVRRSIIEM